MRRRTPMRWIEEAEARQMRLYDAESKPAAAPMAARPEFLLATKATLTVLVARMTGRVARATREEPPAGEKDTPADGCEGESIWIEIARGAPYRIAGASSAGTEVAAYASSYSRETSLLV